MHNFNELAAAVTARRQALGLKQQFVARQAGITPESLSRFERGHATEFGARKLLAVLAVLDMELQFIPKQSAGSLDELREERSRS